MTPPKSQTPSQPRPTGKEYHLRELWPLAVIALASLTIILLSLMCGFWEDRAQTAETTLHHVLEERLAEQAQAKESALAHSSAPVTATVWCSGDADRDTANLQKASKLGLPVARNGVCVVKTFPFPGPVEQPTTYLSRTPGQPEACMIDGKTCDGRIVSEALPE